MHGQTARRNMTASANYQGVKPVKKGMQKHRKERCDRHDNLGDSEDF